MTWSPEHQAEALREGWGLFLVIDKGRVVTRILEHPAGVPGKAPELVMSHARRGSKLHIQALREIAKVT